MRLPPPPSTFQRQRARQTPILFADFGSFTGITPTAANDPPTCALAPASVTLSGTAIQTYVLTITTTLGELVEDRPARLLWATSGGTALAFVLFLGLPKRRRNWPAGLLMLAMAAVLLGMAGCSSTPTYSTPSTGTSVGTYAVTITGTAGTTTAIGSVSLSIQ